MTKKCQHEQCAFPKCACAGGDLEPSMIQHEIVNVPHYPQTGPSFPFQHRTTRPARHILAGISHGVANMFVLAFLVPKHSDHPSNSNMAVRTHVITLVDPSVYHEIPACSVYLDTLRCQFSLDDLRVIYAFWTDEGLNPVSSPG